MKTDPDIVIDLLPLYFSNEASPASRALVEDYFAQNPGFERSVRASQQAKRELPPQAAVSSGTVVVNRIKTLLRWRASTQGMAIAFSLMPLSFLVENNVLRWMMLRDAPLASAVLWLMATACWAAYFRLSRQLAEG